MNNSKQLLDITVKISLIIQFITFIITLLGIFIKIKSKDNILIDILSIETIVQFIEFIFYSYLLIYLPTLNNNIIASQRYIDWVITTPIMLYSTVLFMEYCNNPSKLITIKSVNKKYGKEIAMILFYNFLMLFFGYMVETNKLDMKIGISLGFIFFGLSFQKIWEIFGKKSSTSKNLFTFLIIIWGLYGVAAVFPVIPKNIMYNILDIISKNFYGIFILYFIWNKKVINN